MATDSDEKNFLDRWSRRKAEVRRQELNPAPEIDELHAEGVAEVQDKDMPEEPDGSELTEEDVEKLDAKSDFSVFMKAAVPAELRRMALKKLWHLDPAYNVIDGLLEYGEDYSQLHKNVGKIQSAYQVGKGYVIEEEEEVDTDTDTDTDLLAGDQSEVAVPEHEENEAGNPVTPVKVDNEEIDAVDNDEDL